MTESRTCKCGQIMPPDGDLCDDCLPQIAEVFADLYETDPAFRAEADRWHPIDSPEGQRDLSSTTERNDAP